MSGLSFVLVIRTASVQFSKFAAGPCQLSQNGLNKTAAPNISENSHPLHQFLLYFQLTLPVTVQEDWLLCSARCPSKKQAKYFRSLASEHEELHAFLAVIVQMCHDLV
jgi:hypothetical protein